MRKVDLWHDLPWLELGPTEEVMRRIEQHICTNRGDFYSIYGPAGCGKSRFMMELSQRLDAHVNIVARDIVAGEESIYQQIGKMLETTEDEHDIIAKLKEIPPTGLKMVLLVDDADKLTNEELSFLYRTKERINKINHRENIAIVLFMDLNNQDIFSKGILRHSNSFTIGPTNLMQLREFVTHVYQHFGREHNYSLTELKQLHAFSYGYPGRVARLISADLEPRFEFEKKHIFGGILALILLGLVAMAGIYHEELLAELGWGAPVAETVSIKTPDSPITPLYYPALTELIETATENRSAFPQGIIFSQGVQEPAPPNNNVTP